MLLQGGVANTFASGLEQARGNLNNGAALQKFKEIVKAQGGDVGMVEHPSRMPNTKFEKSYVAPTSGIITGTFLFWTLREIGFTCIS